MCGKNLWAIWLRKIFASTKASPFTTRITNAIIKHAKYIPTQILRDRIKFILLSGSKFIFSRSSFCTVFACSTLKGNNYLLRQTETNKSKQYKKLPFIYVVHVLGSMPLEIESNSFNKYSRSFIDSILISVKQRKNSQSNRMKQKVMEHIEHNQIC